MGKRELEEKVASATQELDEAQQQIEGIQQEGSMSEDERREFAQISQKIKDVVNVMKELNRYTSIEELFNLAKLRIITHLDTDKVNTITKFDTYRKSQKMLYQLDDNDPALELIDEMTDSWCINMISYQRKSRLEVRDILKDNNPDPQRNIGRLGFRS